MRVLGVDPGSWSWDFIGYSEEEGIFLDHSVQTKKIMNEPEIFDDIMSLSGPFDLISAPSGFGLPLKKVEELKESDIFYTLLKKPKSNEAVLGLSAILHKLKENKVNGYIIPSVKHLPTVPKHRKINKIDLGTADKLCTSIVGIRNQMEDFSIPESETGFIMVEIGYAFSAVLAVEHGKIIDGIGGSNIMGFKAAGCIDGEIAYLMGNVKKSDIYRGGVSTIVGYGDMKATELLLLAKKDEKTFNALNAFYESLIKAIFAISSSFKNPRNIKEILFSGRLSKIEELIKPIRDKVESIAPVKRMRSYAEISKESAQGAAFIADGLLGGKHQSIIDNLEIKSSSGNILDDIFLPIDKF